MSLNFSQCEAFVLLVKDEDGTEFPAPPGPSGDFNFAVAAMVIAFTVILTTYPVFAILHCSGKFPWLKHRPFFLNTLITCGVVSVFLLLIQDIVGDNAYPCIIRLLLTTALNQFVLFPLAIRLSLFYYKVQLNTFLANEKYFQPTLIRYIEEGGEDLLDVDLIKPEKRLSQENITRTERSGLESSLSNAEMTAATSSVGQPAVNSTEKAKSNKQGATTSPTLYEIDESIERTLKRKKAWAAPGIHLIGFVLFYIISLAATLTLSPALNCHICSPRAKIGTYPADLVATVLNLIVCIFGFFAMWRIKNEPDPNGIRREAMWCFYLVVGGLILFIVLSVSVPPSKNRPNFFFIFVFTSLTIYIICIPLQIYFAFKEKSKGSDGATSSNEFLVMMKSKLGRAMFKLHLVESFSLTNYLLYEEMLAWKNLFSKSSKNKNLARLKHLYDTYLDEEHSRLWISVQHDERVKIERAIESHEFDARLLDEIIYEVQSMIMTHSFIGFKESRHYQKYITGSVDEVEADEPGVSDAVDLPKI